ncbi:MAG: cytidylate kinase-like family protein, partial [Acidimicrobiales bacterium]
MKRTVICVSHATGADGTDLGRLVAEKLGFRLVDEEIVTRAAESQNVTVDDLADVERRKSLLSRIVREIAVGAATGPAELFVTAYVAEPQLAKNSLRALIRQSIIETADEGNVVIVSHAASYALPDRDDVLRVLVTASPETRIRRLGDANGLDDKQATKSIGANDAGRADYLKRFYGIAEEQATHYDLVINTDRILADRWCEIVVSAS